MWTRLKGYRTFLFNALTGLGMVIPPILDLVVASNLFSPRVTLTLGIINVVGNVWLRTITDTPAGQGE